MSGSWPHLSLALEGPWRKHVGSLDLAALPRTLNLILGWIGNDSLKIIIDMKTATSTDDKSKLMSFYMIIV